MAEQCIAFGTVDEEVFPYVLFLPTNRARLVTLLHSVFGTAAKIDILKRIPACGDTRIYQKDLIETLPYSNKTVIKNLKELCALGVLAENMEKQQGKKDVWVKYYEPAEKMTWLVLLFKEPQDIENMPHLILELASLYYRGLTAMAETFGVSEEDIRGAMGLPGG
ncbi:MAG: hypothetical protein PHW58_05775 [Candidatus Methanofastidiosa archaeon]|jgi:hypothetical protein|nr:hypothetical protein [Candidatus Methanofastidiosa archaeon]